MPVILKPILPKKFNDKALFAELVKGMEPVEAGILKDYRAGVKDWDTEVEFTSKTTINPHGAISVEVDTDNEIYGFVHEGTRPHTITAKGNKRLRFQGTYMAKTVPGVIQSRPGGPSGDFISRKQVQHPGFKGRFFSKPIKKKWGPLMTRQINRAMVKAAKASGHAI